MYPPLARTRASAAVRQLLPAWLALILAWPSPVAAEPSLRPRRVDALLRRLAMVPPPGRDLLAAEAATMSRVRQSPSGIAIQCLIRANARVLSKLRALGATDIRSYGDVHTAFVPLAAIPEIAAIADLEEIRAARRLEPSLDVSVPSSNPLGIDLTAPGPAQGLGVIIGIVDTGVDWTHPDFDDAQSVSRILYSWDQASGSITQPALGEAGHPDTNGHGTHVASTAAGAGHASNSPRYMGVAAGADLIAVATTFVDADILAGVEFVFERAAALGRPAVVNLSLGGHAGPHDGTDALDIGLDALSGPGRIVVAAAGNEGGDRIHAAGTVTVATADAATAPYLSYDGGSNVTTWIDIYHDALAPLRVWVYKPGRPSGTYVGPVEPGATLSLSDLYVENAVSGAAANGKANIVVGTAMGKLATDWRILLAKTRLADPDPGFHAWLYYSTNGAAVFRSDGTFPGDSAFTVGSPATAMTTISTCAYVTKEGAGVGAAGDLASFSSRGPTVDGRPGPDLCAPGSLITAALSSDVGSGFYQVMQGTSMASPHVTGLVALMLAEQPRLTSEAARSQLAAASRSGDGWVPDRSMLPDADWGWGKVDADAAVALAGELLPSISGVETWPAAPGAQTTIAARSFGFARRNPDAAEHCRFQWQRWSGTAFENIPGAAQRSLAPGLVAAGDTVRVMATPIELHPTYPYYDLLFGGPVFSTPVVIEDEASVMGALAEVGGWAMLSVPTTGAGSEAVRTDFAASLWLWDEEQQSYRAAASITRGLGYFVYAGALEGEAHSLGSVQENDDFVTPLLTHTQSVYRPGRHLLGNPFNRRIYWQNIEVSADGFSWQPVTDSSLIQPVYYGAYSIKQGQYLMNVQGGLDGAINPWEALWVVVNEPVFLRIPAQQVTPPETLASRPTYPALTPYDDPSNNAEHSASPSSPVRAGKGARASTSAALVPWSMRLSAFSGPARDDYNFVGLDAAASNGRDRQDILDGGTLNASYVLVSMPRASWGEHTGAYCRDVQQLDRAAHVWEVQVEARLVSEPVTLVWQAPPADWSVSLLDSDVGVEIDMHGTRQYSFAAGGAARRFVLTAAPVEPRRRGPGRG